MADWIDEIIRDIVIKTPEEQAAFLAMLQSGHGPKMTNDERSVMFGIVVRAALFAAEISGRGVDCKCGKGVIYRDVDCPFCGQTFVNMIIEVAK